MWHRTVNPATPETETGRLWNDLKGTLGNLMRPPPPSQNKNYLKSHVLEYNHPGAFLPFRLPFPQPKARDAKLRQMAWSFLSDTLEKVRKCHLFFSVPPTCCFLFRPQFSQAPAQPIISNDAPIFVPFLYFKWLEKISKETEDNPSVFINKVILPTCTAWWLVFF